MAMTIVGFLDLILIRDEKEKETQDSTLSIYKQIFSLFSIEIHRSFFFSFFSILSQRWENKREEEEEEEKKGAVSLSILYI